MTDIEKALQTLDLARTVVEAAGSLEGDALPTTTTTACSLNGVTVSTWDESVGLGLRKQLEPDAGHWDKNHRPEFKMLSYEAEIDGIGVSIAIYGSTSCVATRTEEIVKTEGPDLAALLIAAGLTEIPMKTVETIEVTTTYDCSGADKETVEGVTP